MKQRQTFEQGGYVLAAWNEKSALVRNAGDGYELFAVSDNDIDGFQLDGRSYEFDRQTTQSDIIDFFNV